MQLKINRDSFHHPHFITNASLLGILYSFVYKYNLYTQSFDKDTTIYMYMYLYKTLL